jgi:outer membrane immunogenic protein
MPSAVSSTVSNLKFSLEAGGGWTRNGFEDSNFTGSGFIGGGSGEFDVPIAGGTYGGLSVSVLGSSISGSTSDPITSKIQVLVPIDAVLGATFTPSDFRWPLSIYAFGGLAIGDVKASVPPFSATQTMTGWSIGIGGEIQLTPSWSVV